MTPADQAVEALLAEMRSAADSIEWRAGRPDLTPMTHRRLERLRRPQAVVWPAELDEDGSAPFSEDDSARLCADAKQRRSVTVILDRRRTDAQIA
jgi:hypothetical protein